MTTEYDHVNTCPVLGHLYQQTFAMRCSHREAVVVTGRVWLDDTDGTTRMLWEEVFHCGPFDDHEYTETVITEMSIAGARFMLNHRFV